MSRRARRLLSMLAAARSPRPRRWRLPWSAVAHGTDAHGKAVREEFGFEGVPRGTSNRRSIPTATGIVSFAKLTGFYIYPASPVRSGSISIKQYVEEPL